jgi:hypothetical protein
MWQRGQRLVRSFVCLQVVLATAACGGDFTGPASRLQIALEPATVLSSGRYPLTLLPGSRKDVTVTVIRPQGFEGAVQVTVEGLVTGVTVSPITIPVKGSVGTLTLQAAATAGQADANVTVRATGENVEAAQAQLAYSVTSPPPSFAVALASRTVSVAQGGSNNVLLSVSRTNFTGTVNLTTSRPANGLSLVLDPAAVTAESSLVTVAAAATMAPGTYPVILNATGTAVASWTDTLKVTVTAAAGS